MRSRLRRTGQRSAAYYSLRLLLLLVIVAAKPDWEGSRGDQGEEPSSEWNAEPRSDWWQYECRIDGDTYQTRDKPKKEPIFCQNKKHLTRVAMKLTHRPGEE